MKILAIIFLSLIALQDKSVQQETKKAEAPAEQQEVKVAVPAPSKSGVIVVGELPAEIKIKIGDGETKILTQEEIKKLIENSQASTEANGIVFENGAFYIKTGNFKIPLSGGGASGCVPGSPEKSSELLKSLPVTVKDEKENSDNPKQQ